MSLLPIPGNEFVPWVSDDPGKLSKFVATLLAFEDMVSQLQSPLRELIGACGGILEELLLRQMATVQRNIFHIVRTVLPDPEIGMRIEAKVDYRLLV
jgi:hypothetical protein